MLDLKYSRLLRESKSAFKGILNAIFIPSCLAYVINIFYTNIISPILVIIFMVIIAVFIKMNCVSDIAGKMIISIIDFN